MHHKKKRSVDWHVQEQDHFSLAQQVKKRCRPLVKLILFQGPCTTCTFHKKWNKQHRSLNTDCFSLLWKQYHLYQIQPIPNYHRSLTLYFGDSEPDQRWPVILWEYMATELCLLLPSQPRSSTVRRLWRFRHRNSREKKNGQIKNQ